MPLPPDLAAMLTAFAEGEVRYLLIGGHAVGVHARPRSTKDVDLWLDAAKANVDRACDALVRLGVPAGLVEELRAARLDEIVWLGRAPARVNFLFTIPGVTFEPAWARRVDVEIDAVRVHVIGREDLIANKRAVGRPRDLRDVRALEKAASVGPGSRRR